MKKNKNLSRAWLWGYICLIFPGVIPAFLSIKNSSALAYVFAVVAVLDLALLIIAHVFYTKKRHMFPLFALLGQGINAGLIVYGFVREVVNTAIGQPAVYPWVVSSLGIVIMVFVLWQTISVSLKIIRGEKIIEGKQ